LTTNTCDQLLDYFNRTLEEQEEMQFEEHLASCTSCQEELQELTALTEDLPYLSIPVNPPTGMKDRILINVFNEEEVVSTTNTEESDAIPLPFARKSKHKKASWSVIALAAALLLSLVGNIYSFTGANQASEKPLDTSLDKLVKEVELQSTTGEDFFGTASLVEKDGVLNVVVKANGLSTVEGEQVYQVWLLEDGQPYRAGSFVPTEDGSGVVTYEMNVDGDHNWDTVAITLEPNINSETPFGEVLLASEL
jgi:hypothetical protein